MALNKPPATNLLRLDENLVELISLLKADEKAGGVRFAECKRRTHKHALKMDCREAVTG